jgi:hypothetical protein
MGWQSALDRRRERQGEVVIYGDLSTFGLVFHFSLFLGRRELNGSSPII